MLFLFAMMVYKVAEDDLIEVRPLDNGRSG